jgi:CheY-like chemotaxis protein
VLVRVGVDSESSQVQVSVLDSGVGIPPEKIDRIFESFEQADSSSTRKYGGTGLGLSISRRLVEMMGGEIRVASEPGVGSVFSFTLDCGVAEGAERLAERRAAVVEALSGERVRFVDESVTERTILAAMAGSAGMRAVFSATSAEQARALLARARDEGDPIRYAVISANGPDDDAFGLIERIDDVAFPDLVVVLLTLASPHPALQAVDRLGVAARLMKPVRETDLLEVFATTRARLERGDTPFEKAEASDRAPTPSLEILLVEDSPANQKLALAILGGVGHRVALAGDGRQALDALRERSFDVVLMDVQMPVMDGLQATAAIRAGDSVLDPSVPIVAMTAHALPGDRRDCLAAGMDAYLSKPIARDDLLDTLLRVARRERIEG